MTNASSAYQLTLQSKFLIQTPQHQKGALKISILLTGLECMFAHLSLFAVRRTVRLRRIFKIK